MIGTYSAGDNIAAYCTRCRLVLDHAIVAMDGETIAKVKCKTCGSAHKYRSGAPEPGKKRATVKRTEPAQNAEMMWESCLAEAKGKEHVYDVNGKYRVGDIVEHNVFGRGVVRKIYSNKCDILFKDKERLMAMAI